MAAAVSKPDPMSGPVDPDVTAALIEHAEDVGLDVREILNIESYPDERSLDSDDLALLFDAVRWEGVEPRKAWDSIRMLADARITQYRDALEYRQRQEERLVLSANLSDSAELVMRYEAHLSRLFDQTLRQLDARRSSRA